MVFLGPSHLHFESTKTYVDEIPSVDKKYVKSVKLKCKSSSLGQDRTSRRCLNARFSGCRHNILRVHEGGHKMTLSLEL